MAGGRVNGRRYESTAAVLIMAIGMICNFYRLQNIDFKQIKKKDDVYTENVCKDFVV